jgi:hypothetical protein
LRARPRRSARPRSPTVPVYCRGPAGSST